MVRVAISPPSANANPTLKGHTLVLLQPENVDHLAENVQALFPDLKIVTHQQPWAQREAGGISDENWANATVLLTGSTVPTPEKAPNIKFVQLMSAGANHVVGERLFKEKVAKLCTANGVHGPQISEWVVASFLSHQHSFGQYLEQQKAGKWQKLTSPVYDAVSQRVGILGYGSIGRQVARVCTAMGMSVHAYTLSPKNTPASRMDHSYHPVGLGDPDGSLPTKWFHGSSKEDLHTFLSSGLDLLVIALPLTPSTTKLISTEELACLAKNKTFVSNIARGGIVDTEALCDALENETIRGAALDVTDPEPLPDGHKLWYAKNCIITPHISGNSASYQQRVFEILKINLGKLSSGTGDFMNEVDTERGY